MLQERLVEVLAVYRLKDASYLMEWEVIEGVPDFVHAFFSRAGFINKQSNYLVIIRTFLMICVF